MVALTRDTDVVLTMLLDMFMDLIPAMIKSRSGQNNVIYLCHKSQWSQIREAIINQVNGKPGQMKSTLDRKRKLTGDFNHKINDGSIMSLQKAEKDSKIKKPQEHKRH